MYDPQFATKNLMYLSSPEPDKYALSLMHCGSIHIRNSSGVHGLSDNLDTQRPALFMFVINVRTFIQTAIRGKEKTFASLFLL